MSSRINPEGKSARAKMRIVMRETERLIDKLFSEGIGSIRPETLRAQVALNLELTLRDVEPTVDAYVDTRQDLYIAIGSSKGKFIIKRTRS